MSETPNVEKDRDDERLAIREAWSELPLVAEDDAPQMWRKKPVEIAALLFDGRNARAVADWCGGFVVSDQRVDIPTLEGTMTATQGDYIIRGVQGEFYPCKPDIFEATYECVIPPASTEETPDA